MTDPLDVLIAIAPESEALFQYRVERLAEEKGWRWLHIPRSRVGKRFLTRAKGPLARGWFDLLLLRDARILGVELKKQKGHIRPEQKELHDFASRALECYIWRPSDWDEIERVLD
jgi:hypothetical protein